MIAGYTSRQMSKYQPNLDLEKIIAIDGEYLHIMPGSGGKTVFEGQGKTTTVHFSNVVGCKVTRRHPTNFKVCSIHELVTVVLIISRS